MMVMKGARGDSDSARRASGLVNEFVSKMKELSVMAPVPLTEEGELHVVVM